MKKFLLSIALLIIAVSLTGCGSGSSTSSGPDGNNPGVPSVVQLVAGQYTVQTNSQVLFHAKVLDGNGISLKDISVIFTNISPIGTLDTPYSANAISAATVTTVVKTNSIGIATIAVKSTSEGFVTLRAEVDEAINQSRDSRTVLFLSDSSWPPVPTVPIPVLELDVDGDGDKIFNETDDFILLQDDDDTIVEVRATVSETFGGGIPDPQSSRLVTFGADVPWKNGEDGSCSGGFSECEVIFLFGNTAFTDSLGQASVFVQVHPNLVRDVQTLFNVTAVADNGAGNLVTLFIEPITLASIKVSANPARVDTNGSSTITAQVTTSAGTVAPDGTTVNFTVSEGGIEPFAQTTDGIAESTYSASDIPGGKTITASAGGVSGTTQVTVVLPPEPPVEPGPLEIFPPTTTIATNAVLNTRMFTISEGTPPYQATSDNPLIACNDLPLPGNGLCGDPTDLGFWNGSPIKVTIDSSSIAADTTVVINVVDSDGGTAIATISIIFVP